jgi:hypothetical protein
MPYTKVPELNFTSTDFVICDQCRSLVWNKSEARTEHDKWHMWLEDIAKLAAK